MARRGSTLARKGPQHQRIRFRRDEIADLDALPSARIAERGVAAPRSRRAWPSAGRRLAIFASAAVFLFFALAAALYGIGATGFAQERMRAAAEKAIERLAGRDMAVRIGSTRITLDGAYLVGLEVSDIGLKAAGQPEEFARAASLRFGVELLPLLSGRIVPTSARLSDASFDPGAFGSRGKWDYLAALRDERGLLDPDRVPPLFFRGLHRIFDALTADGATSIELENVSLLPGTAGGRRLVLASAQMWSDDAGSVRMEARGTLEGRGWDAEGSATRSPGGAVTNVLLRLTTDASEAGDDGKPAAAGMDIGAIKAELTGRESTPSRLAFAAEVSALNVTFDMRPQKERLTAHVKLAASLTEGQNKVEIEHLRLASGASTFDLNGAVGPRPPALGEEALYRYELIGDDLVVAASDSPEPPLHFKGALGGTYDPTALKAVADRLVALTDAGGASATAAVQFEPGRSPGLDFSLRTKGVPVAYAKQLWPWTAARGARVWAQQHLREGTVTEGQIEFHVLPGRIGSGIPSTSEEVSGKFSVAGTSFDTAGALPKVTDASGLIEFRGTDADVALTAGSLTLPSGRVLQAADTALTFRAMHRPPLIGKLDGEVRGDAAAAAEFVALDPINALSKLPFKPDDLSGTLVAHVTADIPLQRGIPRDDLDWLVIADFKDLALAEPLEGQQLSAAAGTLSAEPSSVQVEAQARLNGVPAKLDFVEPLKPDGPERKRGVELTLDDKARDTLAPGLSKLVTGPVVLTVDAAAPERKVAVDLSKARLDLPWVGWSKGSGVAASAAFVLKKDGDTTRISDLKVSGQSFSVDGELSLVRGGIQSARFGNVQLNRGDRLAVDVDRKGGGYAIAVRGETFDGRALVKASMPSSGKQSSKGRAAAPDIVIEARIDSVLGFGDEALKNLALSFSSAGAARSLSASATTGRGAAVSMQDETAAGGKRALAMSSADGGSVLRFFGIYPNMQGGAIQVALSSRGGGPLKGDVAARNFVLVNEPRLASLVSSKPKGADRSLGEAVRKDIDVSRVTFSRASATVEKGPDFLTVEDGILRSAAIGSSFQGTVYDAQGRMNMTGTFMPAYGLNRLFGELPLIGVILGNGNDRGLLGVTFKLEGNAKSPTVTVNPLSIIAPGIFRQIFEFEN